MWIIFILIIVAAAIIAVGIAEHKRKEKAKERARQRREKRMAALERQKQEHQKAFASDVGPAETEEGQALSESEELFTPAEPEQEIEASSEPQEAETEEEPAAEEEAAEEKRPEPKKKSRSIEKEAARQREESALDILTERYSYIEEDELENKREKRKAVLWIIGVVVLLLLLVLVVYLWLFRPGKRACKPKFCQCAGRASGGNPVYVFGGRAARGSLDRSCFAGNQLADSHARGRGFQLPEARRSAFQHFAAVLFTARHSYVSRQLLSQQQQLWNGHVSGKAIWRCCLDTDFQRAAHSRWNRRLDRKRLDRTAADSAVGQRNAAAHEFI